MNARLKLKRARCRQKRAQEAQEKAALRDKLLKYLYYQRLHEGIRDGVLRAIVPFKEN